MNKKFLSAILFGAFMVGTSVTFTGCIDNDEPEGITALRGAKAELLKAKALVEAAKVELVAAQARYQAALAATQEAIAKQEEAEAKRLELIAELQGILNEEEKARVEAQIAYYQNVMIENAKKLEISLQLMETDLASAKRQYEVLMQQIEVAKALGSQEEGVTLAYLENEVDKAYALLYGGEYLSYVANVWNEVSSQAQSGFVTDKNFNSETTGKARAASMPLQALTVKVSYENSFAGKLRAAQKKVYDLTLLKAEGGTEGTGDDKVEFNWIPTLEVAVEAAEANLAAANEALKKVEEFLDKDVETTDWRAEIEELEDSVNILAKAISEKKVEEVKVLNTPEYLAAKEKVYGLYEGQDSTGTAPNKEAKWVAGTDNMVPEGANLTWIKEGTAKDLYDAKQDLQNKMLGQNGVEQATFSYEAWAAKTAVSQAMKTAMNATGVTYDASFKYAGSDDAGKYTWKWDATQKKYVTVSLPVTAKFEAWTKVLDKATANANDAAQAEAEKASKAKTEEAAEKAYLAGYSNWEIALSVAKGGDDTVPADDVIAAVKDFNAGVTALETAVKAYNAAYDAQVTAGSTAYETKEQDKLKLAAFDGTDPAELNTGKNYVLKFALDKAVTLWNASAKDAAAYEAALDRGVLDLKKTTGTDEEIAASIKEANEVRANAVAYINLYVSNKWAAMKLTESVKEAIAGAGTDAAKAWAAANSSATLRKAVTDAVGKNTTDAETGLNLAQVNLQEAMDAYKANATSPYAQELKTPADFTIANLVVKSKSGNTYNSAFITGTAETKYAMAVAVIDEAQVGKLGEVKRLADKESALDAESKKVFGTKVIAPATTTKRWVAVTADEYRNAYTDGNGTFTAGSDLLGSWLAAQDALEACEARINAADDLAALKKEVAEQKAAFEKKKAEDYKAAFGKLEEAITAAQNAHDAAVVALNAEIAKANPVAIEVAQLEAKQAATLNVLEELIEAVEEHLGLEFKLVENETDGTFKIEVAGAYDFSNTESFVEELEQLVFTLKTDVATKEQNLVKAENALLKAQEGKYDALANAQLELEQAQANFDNGQADYQKALDNLNKALEILSK